MQPFTISVPDEVLEDLRLRLLRTRWPDEVPGAGWDYGAELAYMRELVQYWVYRYDWRKHERLLNAVPQYLATVDGHSIHFAYVRGTGPGPLPLVITHGWPSTFAELVGILGPLSDPGAHGGDPADAFDVVVPSLPGFGFSEPIPRRGMPRVDTLWRKLMTDVLGYPRFVAHGTDVGARVTSALGRFHGDVVSAIHIGSVDLEWPDPLPAPAEMTDAERDYVRRVERWKKEQGAYAEIQATTPQTAAYGLNDSPAGLAAWIVEKWRAWSECGGEIDSRFTKDELLTNVMIYWATQTINASMRRYFEVRNNPAYPSLPPGERIVTPAAIAMFPGERELVVPREWADRCYTVARWTEMPRGGHFPAIEEPELLVGDIREFFRGFRTGARP